MFENYIFTISRNSDLKGLPTTTSSIVFIVVKQSQAMLELKFLQPNEENRATKTENFLSKINYC